MLAGGALLPCVPARQCGTVGAHLCAVRGHSERSEVCWGNNHAGQKLLHGMEIVSPASLVSDAKLGVELPDEALIDAWFNRLSFVDDVAMTAE